MNEKMAVRINGYKGTWYSIDTKVYDDRKLYLMEHEYYGDEVSCIIIDEHNNLMAIDISNGFDDYDYCLEEGINPLTHEIIGH